MTRQRKRLEFGRLRGRPSRPFGPLSIEFLSGEDGRGAMTAMRVVIRAGDRHPPVLHRRTAEFFLVLKGTMTARIAGKRRGFRAGDHASLPPGTAHAFRAGPGGVEVLAVFAPGLDPATPDIVPAPRA